jgi:hypothetical protein
MKKVIYGHLYDTESATCVGSYSNEYDYNDINSVDEYLYRKKNGEFFLYAYGGANTEYSRKTGPNTWSAGKAIIPMDLETAKIWVEEHLDGDEYIKIFGEVEE